MVNPPLQPGPFLRKKVNFLVMLAVVATTVFSKYNLNSWCIFLLVFCRLVDGGPVRAIKAAFANNYFLAFLALFLVDVAGQLYTHNPAEGARIMERDATMIAISFVLCGGQFADGLLYRQFMTAYCLLLFAACLYCGAIGVSHYLTQRDVSVFFYHSLSRPIGQNAVFFSVYMIFGLLFLLSHPLQMGPLGARVRKPVQIVLILFFIAIIVLLSSKLLLIVLLLLLASLILERFISRKKYWAIAISAATLLVAVLWLTLMENPIKKRYQDLEKGDLSLIKANKFTTTTEFNGAQLRLLQWRYANQIMQANHAWLFGVSPGDSQDLLNEKYKKAGVDTGIPGTRQKGFLDYNFHNQYIETTVRSGFLGLVILLTICWLFILMVIRQKTMESFFIVLTLILILSVESFLTLQHGIFAFTFIPLMQQYSPRIRKKS
jgi:O-antigen ligase